MAFCDPILPTKEQQEQITANDYKTITAVYMANYGFLLNVCKAYYRTTELLQGKHNELYQDMMQDVFLYFSKIDFANVGTIVRTVKDICLWCRFGGQRQYDMYRQGVVEVVQTMDILLPTSEKGGTHTTQGDTIPDPKSIFDYLEPLKDNFDLLFDVVYKFCTNRQATALKLHCETNLTDREIGKVLGCSLNGARSLRLGAVEKLRQNLCNFVEMLKDNGYDIGRYKDKDILQLQLNAIEYKQELNEKAKNRRKQRLAQKYA